MNWIHLELMRGTEAHGWDSDWWRIGYGGHCLGEISSLTVRLLECSDFSPSFISTHSCQQHVPVFSSPKSVYSLMMLTLPSSRNPLELAVTAFGVSISSLKLFHPPWAAHFPVPSLCLLWLASTFTTSSLLTGLFNILSIFFFKAKID